MLVKWMSLLRVFGWNTPTKEMTYATTALDTEYETPILFENEIIKRVSRKAGFKVLGTIITFDCQDDVELERRFLAAWGSFLKFSSILLCRSIPLEKRFVVLARAIHPSLFWCAGSWNLRHNQLPKLRDLQRSMIRKMMHFKFRPDETMGSFMHRTESSISHVFDIHNVQLFDGLAHRAVFRWAGKLTQIQLHDPSRLTSIVFGHKDWDWIQLVASQHNGRQLHGRRLRTWRWERPLYKCFSDSWKALASDQSEWASHESSFLAWRNMNR